ncbi:hypothetical protein MKY59_21035 [Paenibacillus sp. FSL W8-0426]|uniref:hypothetical protein n=1 Tax=Paenibacillus sp. FSL W8-0426 TaxID=2921714 RepID=UPI0030DC7578
MHVEYDLLDKDGVKVSLAADNVEYIKRDGVNLAPDDQETLWFNVTKPAGSYVFEVRTKAGVKYVAILDWVPDPMP